MIYTLFNNTSNIVDLIEVSEKVNLTKVKEGVFNMIDYEERTKQRVETAKQETLEMTAKILVESVKEEKPDASYTSIFNKVDSLLKLDNTMKQRLQEIYSR